MLEWIARRFCKPSVIYRARVMDRRQEGRYYLVELEVLEERGAGWETVLVSEESYRLAVPGDTVRVKVYYMGIRGKPTIIVLERV